MNNSQLSKLTSPYGEWLEDTIEGKWVYHVTTPHLLLQAAGYLKHVNGKSGSTSVFYRGQHCLYGGSLKPSLYRGISAVGTANKKNTELNNYLKECAKQGKILKHVPNYAWEPLLQHYGIRTRWIDLVDNVWVALWFACHTVHATGKRGEFFHFEQRRTSSSEFAYIVLVKTEYVPQNKQPGFYSGKSTELIDLRIATPSFFLRPHAQHGLLARAKGVNNQSVIDYKDMIAGVLRVNMYDALKWLGDGHLLTTHVLFPPPVYDFGYCDLLEFAPLPEKKSLGAIHHVGA